MSQAAVMMLSGVGPLSAQAKAARRPARLQSDVWGPRFLNLILIAYAVGLAVGLREAVVALTLIGMAAAIIGLFRPVVGLFGVGMLSSLDSASRAYTEGLLPWSLFTYWLLLVAVLGIPCLLKMRDAQTRLLMAFILLLAAGLALSPKPVVGIWHLLGILGMLGQLVYFARVQHDERVWHWLGIVNGLVGAGGGFVFYFQHEHPLHLDIHGWAYLPLTALFSIYLASNFHQHPRRLLLLHLLAAVNLVWVFLSGSRGGMVVAAVCLIFMIAAIPGVKRRLMYTAIAVMVGAAVAAHFVTETQFAEHRLKAGLDPHRSTTGRTSGRSDLIEGGWRVFLDHPLGVGTGGYAVAWKEVSRREGLSGFQGIEKPAHSAWIKTLSENGLQGLLLMGAYVLSFAVVGRRRKREGMQPLGLMVTTTLAVAFLFIEFQGKGLWLLAAGAMTILNRSSQTRPLGEKSRATLARARGRRTMALVADEP